jgi:tRNA(Leu) C34 or U34 (ribose-2'-O)-methylase TrmL
MENWLGDFNLSSCLRAVNALGGSEMYYLGKKHYDKRGAVGTYNYTQITHLSSREELLKLKEKYVLVALENTVPTAQPLYNYEWDKNSLIVAGEEGIGITPETLKICDKFVYIPQYGSVRSMNAAAAVSIALYDYTAKFKK